MHAWQVLVQVAEVVLAELGGVVALRFEDSGEGDGLGRQSYICAGLADGRQTRCEAAIRR